MSVIPVAYFKCLGPLRAQLYYLALFCLAALVRGRPESLIRRHPPHQNLEQHEKASEHIDRASGSGLHDSANSGSSGHKHRHAEQRQMQEAQLRPGRVIDDFLLARWWGRSSQQRLTPVFRELEKSLHERASIVRSSGPGGSSSSGTGDEKGSICQTGFNAGKPLLRYLSQTNADVYVFDPVAHPRAVAAARLLDDHFPGRLTNVWGETSKSVPEFHGNHPNLRCNFVVIDGGRSYGAVAAELKNFAGMVSQDHLLVVDDTPCSARRCHGPSKAWQELQKQGCVTEAGTVKLGKSRGFSFGYYRNCPLWGAVVNAISAVEVSSAGGWSVAQMEDSSIDHRASLDGHLLSRHMGSWTSPDKSAQALAKEVKLDGLLEQLESAVTKRGQPVTEGPIESNADVVKLLRAETPSIPTICEIGFETGQSALRFLSQSQAKFIEFEDGTHESASTFAHSLKKKFGGRFEIVLGDSSVTVPEYHAKHPDRRCDIVIVDGGRSLKSAYDDMGNFAQMAGKEHIVAMDGTPCTSDTCVGPMQAWRDLVQQGCIQELQAVPTGSDRGFTTGHFISCSLWPSVGSQ